MLGTLVGDVTSTTGRGWRPRPLAAAMVRAVIAGVPVVVAVAAGVAAAEVWPRPHSGVGLVWWWAAGVGTAVTCSYLAARAARRLLPLASLFRLSLSFPDRTPSRVALALRAGTVSDLKERARRLVDVGVDIPAAEAAGEVIVLALALTRHDRGTRGHSERVRALTDVLAEELSLSPLDRDRLRWAGLLHDVGKVSVPATILNKPGPLTREEWEVMRTHPAEGAKLLAPLEDWLGPWADVISQHHERYDGSGYPNGLTGGEISLGARIVAVADTFDVMTSARSYKRPLPAAAAREEISAKAGDLFDPAVARALLNVSIGRLRWISGPLAWLLAWPFFKRGDAVAQALQSTAQGAWSAATGGAAIAAIVAAPALPLLPTQSASPRAVRPAAMVAVRQPTVVGAEGGVQTAAPPPPSDGATPVASSAGPQPAALSYAPTSRDPWTTATAASPPDLSRQGTAPTGTATADPAEGPAQPSAALGVPLQGALSLAAPAAGLGVPLQGVLSQSGVFPAVPATGDSVGSGTAPAASLAAGAPIGSTPSLLGATRALLAPPAQQ